MKLRNKIVALFLTVACAFGLAVAGNATRVKAAEEKVTISFANKAQRTSYSTTKQVWEQNGITVTGDKGSSTSNVGDYVNPARFYKSSNIKIEYKDNITKVVITCSGESKYYFPTSFKLSGSTVSVSSATTTITLGTPATSLSITNLPNQIRISKMDVYATPAVSEDMTAEDRVAGAVEDLSIANSVITSMTLPTVGSNETAITWSSSDEDTLGADGVVVLRDVEDTPVTLTATIAYEDVTATKEFEVNVLGEETIVANALASLNITKKINGSIKLPTTAAEVASITWESDDEEILTKAGKLVARPAQDTIVSLTATAKVGGTTATKEIEVTVKGLDRTIVTNPVAGTKYLLMVSQENNVKDNYVNGSMANIYYFATTTNAAQAKTVELIEVDGGFHLVMGDKYINIKASGTHINAVYENAASSVWTFDKTYNTLVTVLSGKTYCLNSYGTYDTVSPSVLSSATFICHLVELTEEETVKAMGVKVGFQVGTKDESKALRLVAAFDFAAEEVANFDKEISFRVTRNGVADERVVTTLYSSVNPMNDEEILEDGYYAVLTYVNIPAGEYLVEVLVDGVVAATVTATVA